LRDARKPVPKGKAMIFQALYRFAKSQKLLDDLDFTEQAIHCVIRLRRSGSLAGILRVTDKDQTKRVLIAKIPTRTSAAIACLGSDTLNRVVPHFDSKANAFAKQTQKLFIEQLESVRKQSKHHGVQAVLKFLKQLHQKKLTCRSVVKKLKAIPFKPSEWVTFEVEGESGLMPEWPVLREWWTRRQTEQRSADTVQSDEVPCMVTGRSCVPVRTHGTRIKVAPGGLPGGTALVSSDKAAFSSYGFDKALVSPMSEEAVEAYIRAINWLGDNRNENYHYRTGYNKGDTIFLFWSDRPLETRNPGKAIELGGLEDLLQESAEPVPASRVPLAAKKVISAPAAGALDSAHAEAASHFYCLSLSGASARAIVRGWIDQPLPIARENVTRWFRDLTVQLDRPLKQDEKIVAEIGSLWSRWPLWQLVACLQGKGDSAKEEVAQQRQQLWEAALLGRPIPLSILCLACRRIPADVHTEGKRKGEWRGVRPERAALIQAVLIRMNKRKDNMKTEINLDEQTVAFHCGRLLRLLQSIQTRALGDTNATIVSRFYAGASAMPGGVFGTLLSKVQPHINKIRGDTPKLAGWFDARIAEVVGYIVAGGGFPATNDPVAQGDFALGFYWQRLATKKEQPEAEPDETETTQTTN
jgi:CRISPR-associated protein Csd1